jgi:aquaporin Z
MTTLRPCVAEFIGTFFLCFAGIAAILCTTPAVGNAGGIVAIAFAHGLALSVAVNAFGGLSGAHFNPAVTSGFLVTGRIKPGLAIAYVISQLLGATTAAGFCRVIFPAYAVSAAHLGIPLPAAWATTRVVLTAEFIMTFLLMTAIFGTAVDDRGRAVKIGGFGIGLTVTFDILAGGAVTGASMNPARSFGPALELGYWAWHWAYWVAPIAGAVVAALLYDKILLPQDPRIAVKG